MHSLTLGILSRAGFDFLGLKRNLYVVFFLLDYYSETKSGRPFQIREFVKG